MGAGVLAERGRKALSLPRRSGGQGLGQEWGQKGVGLGPSFQPQV